MKNAALPIALLIVVLAGRNSKELTRSRAKAIIVQKLQFPKPVTSGVPVGKTAINTGDAQCCNSEIYTPPYTSKWFKVASDKGLISIKNPTRNLIWGMIADVQLSNQGKQFVSGTQGITGMPVKFCDMVFGSVTGIAMMQTPFGNGAQVDYTWKFDNLTPFAITIRESQQYGPCKEDGLHSSSVAMRLFDDGWRLSQ